MTDLRDFYPPRQAPKIKVISTTAGGEGRAFDLSDEVEALRYSSSNPGGDENCTFTIKRSWFADNPEIARGNLLRILAGVDILWQGRVEETDRGADSTETIAVTAYGLGTRLKDGTFREIFADRDLSKWGEPSTQRKLNLINGGFGLAATASVTPGGGGPAPAALMMDFTGVAATASLHEGVELWYYGGDVDIDHLLFDQVGDGTTPWVKYGRLSSDDLFSSYDESPNYSGFAENTDQGVHATVEGRKYASFGAFFTNNGFVGQMTNKQYWPHIIVMGSHGLDWRGTWPDLGFTVDQMVGYVVDQVSGIVIRRLDAQTFVVRQAAYTDPVKHSDAIEDLNKYEGCDWGTWAPDSPLDRTLAGQFDFRDPEPTIQHWSARRAQCEGLDLHSETATLYGKVDVSYEGSDGVRRIVRREVDVPDLDGAGLDRVFDLPLGKGELEDAEAAGDLFLAIWGQFAPARGTVTLRSPIRHWQRGELWPCYLRADGANLRISDILPSSTALTLDRTPDRRTTFAIKRVDVDCSGSVPAASVELDQANDTLTVLQSRVELNQSLLAA